MRRRFLLVALLVACGAVEPEPAPVPGVASTAEPPPAAPLPGPPPPPPDPHPEKGSIGVPTCDVYLAAMEACTSKVPPEGRKAWRKALATSRAAFLDAAKSGTARDALETVCRAALDAISNNPLCR